MIYEYSSRERSIDLCPHQNQAIYGLLNNSVHAIHINFVFVPNGKLTSFARFTKCSFWIF